MARRKRKTGLQEAIDVVARLRAPNGCPWDRKQDHRSLIPFLREEALEVEGAIQGGKWHEIEDELGDLLFQVLLHAQIASESGRFNIDDVARCLAIKLKRRHPHVFGGKKLKTADEVWQAWKAIKRSERRLRRLDVKRRGRRR